MPNEVEIAVKAKDKSDYGPMKAKAKAEGGKAGEEASEAFGKSTKQGSGKAGEEAGKSFGAGIKKWFLGPGKKESEKGGEESGKGFGSGIKKWFAGDGSKLFGKGGQISGESFSSGLMGMLKTPVLGPLLVAAVGGAAAVALPAVGAVAAGALVTGFGAGLAGLGVVFAARSRKVEAVWTKTLGQLGSDMELLSRPFESTLIHIASYFQRTVDKFNPALAKAFGKMAPMVDGFVDDTARGLERLIPALDPITDAFGKVLDSLGPAFQSMIGDLSAGLIELSRSVQKNPEALADMTAAIGSVVRNAFSMISILNDVNGTFKTLTGGTSLVTMAFRALELPMTLISGYAILLNKAFELTGALIGRTGKDVDGAGQSMSDAANKTALLAQGLDKTGAAAQHGAGPVQSMADKITAAKKAAAEAKERFENFISTLFRFQTLALNLSGAQISFQRSIDDASRSLKENGRTLDITTEKGSQNMEALNGVAQAANGQTEQMIRSGRSTQDAGLQAIKSRENFVKLAMQFGKTRPQAEAMARSMIAIPNVTREAKLRADKRDLDTKLAAARTALADPKLSATKKANLRAEIAQLLTAKAKAQAAIDALQGKTVRLNLVTVRSSISSGSGVGGGHEVTDGHAAGGYVKGFANGGNPPAPRGKFWVGEKGPELMSMSGGVGRVTPAGNSARQAAHASGGGQQITLVLEITNPTGGEFGDFMIKHLAPRVQQRGGNVQLILGGRSL